MKTGRTYCKEKKRDIFGGKRRNLSVVGKKLCIIITFLISEVVDVMQALVVPEILVKLIDCCENLVAEEGLQSKSV